MRAKSLWQSFKYAGQGIAYSFVTQRNFRIHCLAAALLIFSLFVLDFTPWEILFLLSAAFAVLIAELINTAIEKAIDLYTSAYHPLAKTAKNCAAAAVLMAALYAVLVALLIFAPRLILRR